MHPAGRQQRQDSQWQLHLRDPLHGSRRDYHEADGPVSPTGNVGCPHMLPRRHRIREPLDIARIATFSSETDREALRALADIGRSRSAVQPTLHLLDPNLPPRLRQHRTPTRSSLSAADFMAQWLAI